MTWEQHFEQLRQIAKSFYQAYRLTGTFKMKFGLRPIADSDGNSVVDVYVSPLDAEAASSLTSDTASHHLQLLETMVPSQLLGYQFLLQVKPVGANDVDIAAVEPNQPFLTMGAVSK